jgi:hypothetical protein
MKDKMGRERTPILGQEFRPIRLKERPGFGDRHTGRDFKRLPERLVTMGRGVPPFVLVVCLAAQAAIAIEAARRDTSLAAELGPTPRVLPAPEGITEQMEKFERTIEEINQGAQIASAATPTATEIQQEQQIPGASEAQVELEMQPDGSAYIRETGFYLKGPMLELYRRYHHVLGPPVSELQSDNTQTFRNLEVAIMFTDATEIIKSNPEFYLMGTYFEFENEWIKVSPLALESRIKMKGSEASREEHLAGIEPAVSPPEDPNVPYFSETGHSLSFPQIAKWYSDNNGPILLGMPITEPREEEGAMVQTFVCGEIEWTPETGAKLKPLGGELVSTWYDAKYGYFLPELPPFSGEEALGQLSETEKEMFQERARISLEEEASGSHTESGLRDQNIFRLHAKQALGREIDSFQDYNPETVASVLAWYEIMYDRDPAILKIMERSIPGFMAINRMLQGEVDPNLFKNNEIPQFPTSVEETLSTIVFKGGPVPGGETYYGDHSHPFISGPWARVDAENEQQLAWAEEKVFTILGCEGVLSWFHPKSNIAHHEGQEQFNFLIHGRGIFVAIGREAIGLEPNVPVKYVYLYNALEKMGAKDPFKWLVNSVASAEAEELWRFYQEHNDGRFIPLEQLFKINEQGISEIPDEQVPVEEQDIQRLRQEYNSYLSS